MVRVFKAGLIVVIAGACFPQVSLAGGNEFPADGVIGLGRGGTGFTRADDPSVMLRNPALLADLWGDQVMISAHVLDADSCFQATGTHITINDTVDLGDGLKRDLDAKEGSTTLDGEPIPRSLVDLDTDKENKEEGKFRPYPEVCYQGPVPYLPQLALTMKLADDLGIGIGFFPPETGALGQFGDANGTLATEDGLEPNPLRYTGIHTNASYFSVMGSIGYRMTDWLRIGAGFQWSLVVVNSTGMTPSRLEKRTPSGDVRTDAFLRDLFIPAFVTSVHVVPMDSLDIAAGFKWADRIKAKAKLDITTGVYGNGEPYTYLDENGEEVTEGARIPVTTHNLIGQVDAPPIWMPQISFGVRYADRLKPRIRDWEAARKASGGHVEDHMSSERWDIEATAVVYLSSVRDTTDFTNDGQIAAAGNVGPSGDVASVSGTVGKCIKDGFNEAGMKTGQCDVDMPARRSRTYHHGKTQYSLRLGGDYNIMPGLLSVRTGVSYETSGSDIAYFDPKYYDQERIGIHGGWTWRIAKVTDLTFGYAMFLHKDVYLATGYQGREIDGEPGQAQSIARYIEKWEKQGLGWEPVPEDPSKSGPYDDFAKRAIGSTEDPRDGPQWANAGKFNSSLQVFSLQLTQHF